MRLLARGAMVVLLSLVLPSEGEAQFRQRSMLADAIEANVARSAAFANLGGNAPRCAGSIAEAFVGGALGGAFVGAVFGFFVGLVYAWGSRDDFRAIVNSTTLGGAAVLGVVNAVQWDRRCRTLAGALP
jgi:hypothetical protein